MKEKSKNYLFNIYPTIKRNIKWLILSALTSLILSIINVISISFEKRSVDIVLNYNKSGFYRVILILVILLLIRVPLEYLKTFLLGNFSERSIFDLKNKLAEHLNKLPIRYIEKNTTGDFLSNLNNDLSLIQSFLQNSLNDLIYQPFVFLLGFIYALTVSWKLTLFCFLGIPPILLLTILISKPIEKWTKKQQDTLGSLTSLVQDAISGIAVVKSFNLTKRFYEKFDKEQKNVFSSGMKSIKYMILIDPFKFIMNIMPFFLMFLIGGLLVVKGEMTFGGLIAFIELMNIFTYPLTAIPNILSSYRQANAASNRIINILNEPTERENGNEFQSVSTDIDIEFEEVYFSYDNESSDILKGVSFKVKKGEKVAIVGASGSGKSTILKLIQGFYNIKSGRIKIFGKSIDEWNLTKLRENITVVNQDSFLFPETIKENIKYGHYDSSDEDIKIAAKSANAFNFIADLPNNFEENVGERGVRLSGGQKQRISIARAILKNAPILLLDEATSSLDVESEYQIQTALERLMEGKTSIIVAHRLSTIKNVDRIFVIDQGKIVEEGTHNSLMLGETIYKKLYQKQFEDLNLQVALSEE
ncbi:ABC transporter ATP-binding protein [Caldicellulosiruptoraceae bacterium PP1]